MFNNMLDIEKVIILILFLRINYEKTFKKILKIKYF